MLNQTGLSSEQLTAEMGSSKSPRLVASSLTDTNLAVRHGVLLRGQPYLEELAWLRRSKNLDQAYSLVGLIHTIAPPAVRSKIGSAVIAPTHPWDALVCTSPAVQQAMETMLDASVEHLSARLGAVRCPRPKLPLIPLAVDTELMARLAADVQARAALRQRLRIAEHDVVVLWVGRLSYYEKAFPQSMFQAMHLAAQRTQKRLHFCLVGWFPGGDVEMKAYKQAADVLAPDLNVIVLDGNDSQLVAQSWASADVFLSLVDNIQETFGLTPVEAMAAGLPVVVSDWDGYRYTVRDGLDGFLVPTLSSPGGAPGELLATLHSMELESYQTYVGAVAQHTAVHVQKAASLIAQLAEDENLRVSMGKSAQQRARTMFAWPEVIRQYKELFDELAERRCSADSALACVGAHVEPSRGEPFSDFQHFATDVLHPEKNLRLAADVTVFDLDKRLEVKLNRQYPGLRCKNEVALNLLQRLGDAGSKGLSVGQLLAGFSGEQDAYLKTTLVWLAKMGLVDWLSFEPERSR
ncbi:glycosyltransferase family 4 protein [Synechococcus sp. UW179A]|uniref:glycosyltransferase family 4 protein n=1 Tax=Synechococcus sp. UW179A TaxID=2575510 RepID=UPI001A7E090F|nr:glycosyltransferase [Synechococcus sp. UW179A]